MTTIFFRFIIAACLLLAYPAASNATKNVSGAGVKENALNVELRNGYELDGRASRDERISQLFFVDYGVNDWLAFRATGRWSKPDGAEHELTATEIMARFQLIESGEDGFSLGSRLIYTDNKKALTPNDLAVQILAEQVVDAWRYRATAEVDRNVGAYADESVAISLAAQALYTQSEQFSYGVEWFGDMGNLANQSGFSGQGHQIGLVGVWEFMPDTQVEFGYLHGVSQGASDSLFKLFIRREF